VFIDRYTVNSVFQGIIWSRLGAIRRYSSWESLSQYRAPDRIDPEATEEEARRVKRKLHRERLQEKHQAKAKLWNPELAVYIRNEEDEEDEDMYSDEDGMYTPVDSDVTMSFFSEEESDFEGRRSSTGSRWSGDSQSASEMEDISGHRGQCSLLDDASKALKWDDIVHGVQGDVEDGSRLERNDGVVPQIRDRWSRDGSDSEREWSTPSDVWSDSGQEVRDNRSASVDSGLPSESRSDSESTCHLPRWKRMPVTKRPASRMEEPVDRDIRQRSPSKDSTTSWEYEYSSDADAQHTRKQHAISKCRILTLSDRFVKRYDHDDGEGYDYGHNHYYGDQYSYRHHDYHSDRYRDRRDDNHIDHSYPHPRLHSHRILHNGKAHLLLSGVTTLRTVTPWFSHPAETTGVENICHRGGSCPFIQGLSPTKVVHRNVGRSCGSVDWTRAKVLNELVLFFPYAGWLPDHVTDQHHQGLQHISTASTKALKIIFGPYVEPEYPSRSILRLEYDWDDCYEDGPHIPEPRRTAFKNWTITNVVQLLHASALHRGELTVYGLERVKVSRGFQYPYFENSAEIPPHRHKWHNRRHRKRAYGPQELAELVQHHLNQSLGRSGRQQVMQSQFRTIEEYLATSPMDELFSCEVDTNTHPDSSWLVSQYWKSKSLWRKSAVIPELGEGIAHESDTDEDTPNYRRHRPTNFKPKEEKALRKRQRYEERVTSRNSNL
jgi:hypothetical protein